MTNDELIVDRLEGMKAKGFVAYWNGSLLKVGKVFYIRRGDLVNVLLRELRWLHDKQLKKSVALNPADVKLEVDLLVKAGALEIKQL